MTDTFKVQDFSYQSIYAFHAPYALLIEAAVANRTCECVTEKSHLLVHVWTLHAHLLSSSASVGVCVCVCSRLMGHIFHTQA